jgi:hypothetical protein
MVHPLNRPIAFRLAHELEGLLSGIRADGTIEPDEVVRPFGELAERVTRALDDGARIIQRWLVPTLGLILLALAAAAVGCVSAKRAAKLAASGLGLGDDEAKADDAARSNRLPSCRPSGNSAR